MTVIIKCPHCGRMEGWRETDGARTHCSFCHQPLSGESQVTEAPKSHAPRPRTSDVLRYTIRGGLFGLAVSVGITCFYFSIPLIQGLLALASDNLAPDERAVATSYLLFVGLTFLIITVVGVTFGSLFMSLVSAILHGRPGLLRPATACAGAGSLLPPMVTFLVVIVPAAITHGPNASGMPTLFLQTWLLSLALAITGSVVGFVGGLIVGVLKHDGRANS